MFTSFYKVLVAALTGLLFISCNSRHASFDIAVKNAKKVGLLEVGRSEEGVPYYAKKTLDPVWTVPRTTEIVTVPRFSFIDQNGQAQTENLFDGKITFVGFFFTSCAGFCPAFLRNLQKVEKRLQQMPDVRYVAISVDPERDSPEQMRRYFSKMGFTSSRWTLLTGDKNLVWSLARDTFAAETFQLPVSKGQIAHSEHFFVIDPQRRLRGVLKGTRLDLTDKAEHLIRELTKSSSL